MGLALDVTVNSEAATASTWTNMPAADTFLFGSHRHILAVDISGATLARLKVNKQATAGFAGSTLRVLYALAFSTTVGDYSEFCNPSISVAVDTTNTYLISEWSKIVPGAFDGSGTVFLAIVGAGGNGQLDPQFGSIAVGFE